MNRKPKNRIKSIGGRYALIRKKGDWRNTTTEKKTYKTTYKTFKIYRIYRKMPYRESTVQYIATSKVYDKYFDEPTLIRIKQRISAWVDKIKISEARYKNMKRKF